MLSNPLGQFGVPCGRRVHAEEVGHQALDFITRNHHVTDKLAEHPCGEESNERGHRNDGPLLSNYLANDLNKRSVCECFRSDRVNNHVLPIRALLDSKRRKIVDLDRLQTVFSVSKDAKHGEVAQCPGNVVDQNILFPKKNRRSENRI